MSQSMGPKGTKAIEFVGNGNDLLSFGKSSVLLVWRMGRKVVGVLAYATCATPVTSKLHNYGVHSMVAYGTPEQIMAIKCKSEFVEMQINTDHWGLFVEKI